MNILIIQIEICVNLHCEYYPSNDLDTVFSDVVMFASANLIKIVY